MSKVKVWLRAARLRTLPLSISGIVVGTTLAQMNGYFNGPLFVLALCTTIGFQVTSNFANDYGDGIKGTDNNERIGPKRVLQSGLLSREELKKGIVISVFINLMLVFAVLYFAFGTKNIFYIVLFLLLGLASIWAAIRYTVGKSAYGYRGLGDIFVFVFFGLLAVLGSMFLFTKTIYLNAFLPATAIGCLSTAVLNLNNLRDCKSDKKAGKNTLVVLMGYENGKRYHYALLILSLLAMISFAIIQYKSLFSSLYLLAFLPIGIHLIKVFKTKEPKLLDRELKKLALSTFLLAVLFFMSYNYFL